MIQTTSNQLQREVISDHSKWVISGTANPGARLRLICLPYAGGSASVFNNWQMRTPTFLEVWSIQLPGHGTRFAESPIEHLHDLCDKIIDALEIDDIAPFALFGHSFGALLSFELTRQLRRQGATMPIHLFVSGSKAPNSPPNKTKISQLSTPDLIEKLRQLRGTPPEVLEHNELMSLVLPALRADFRIFDNYSYVPEPALDIPLSCYSGANDTEFAPYAEDWKHQTTKEFIHRTLPGDHFFLHSHSDLLFANVAEELKARTLLPAKRERDFSL